MPSHQFATPEAVMQRALQLAAQGVGFVEPNPPVGCVIVDENLNLLGEGFHQQFGGPHAEVHALQQAGENARGATLFVTLEPCCHHGKTPPCAQAVIDAGVKRVVIASRDHAPHVAGGGIAQLKAAGIQVECGLLRQQSERLLAPFFKLVLTGLPYVHAKWAMTLDGKIAARTGHSQWISNDGSREIVHRLRGRMDAIMVGSGTAEKDDPTLTARPADSADIRRTPTRIVVDSTVRLSLNSKLVQSAQTIPVLLFANAQADSERIKSLHSAGVEVVCIDSSASRIDLKEVMQNLGARRMTHVLVEGGGELLGSFFDADLIDEYHIFMAPKLVGGAEATSPMQGKGLAEIPQETQLTNIQIENLDGDIYFNATRPVAWKE